MDYRRIEVRGQIERARPLAALCQWSRPHALLAASGYLAGAAVAGRRAQHFVHQAVVAGLDGGHVQIAVGVLLDALDGLAGVVAEDLVQIGAQAQNLLGLDGDVGGLAARAAEGLVQMDGGVGQGVACLLYTSRCV